MISPGTSFFVQALDENLYWECFAGGLKLVLNASLFGVSVEA